MVNSGSSGVGQNQSPDLAQAMLTLQSTLMEFQRRNEEAQRRAQESQAAMLSVLSAFMQGSNGTTKQESLANLPQAAEHILRDRNVLASLAAPAQPASLPQFELDGQANHTSSKGSTQKQLLQLLQALQAHGGQGQSDTATLTAATATAQMLASANTQKDLADGQHRTHTHPSRPSLDSRPQHQSKADTRYGNSSPPQPARMTKKDKLSTKSMHASGAQSSPVLHASKVVSSSKRSGASARSQQSVSRARPSQSSFSEAPSPILGGLTPGYEADYLSGPSPTYSAGGNAAAPPSIRDFHGSASRESSRQSLSIDDNRNSSRQCCYNCGIHSEPSWRYVAIVDESQIRHYNQSVCVVDGARQFRACNACGMYYAKFKGVSRPEYIWRKSSARRNRQNNKRSQEETTSSSTSDDEDPVKRGELDRTKRSSFARTLSEACAIDSKRLAPDSMAARANISSSSLGGVGRSKLVKERKSSGQESTADSASHPKASNRVLTKTSEPVHAIEATDSEDDARSSSNDRSQAREPGRRVYDFQKARLKDFVLDSLGRWRTKRSILENPTGRRVGRPAGMKTGEGEGRQRSNPEKKAEALRRAKIEVEKAKILIAERMAGMHHSGDDDDIATSKAKKKKKEPVASKTDESAQLMDALQAILSASSPVQDPTHGTTKLDSDGFTLPPTHNLIHSTPGGPSGFPTKTPLSITRASYGAPAHLLNSSPATAFQTVMDEADTDWKALFGFGAGAGVPRRSPRKKPPGTNGMVNPYATSTLSPSLPKEQQQALNGLPSSLSGDKSGGIDANLLMQMTSSSPLTRNRVKSGQFGWAWTSSDDAENGRKKNGSSAITSPASPSPTRSRSGGAKRKIDMTLEAGPLSKTSIQVDSRPAKRVNEQNVPATTLNAGPFMGLHTSDPVQVEDEEDEEEGPGSPTLGRSRRLDKKKFSDRANSGTDAASSVPSSSTPSEVMGQPSSTNIPGVTSHAGMMVDLNSTDWTRTGSMRDLFPNMSPDKNWNAASPSQALWNSPTSWALRMPTPSPVKAHIAKDPPTSTQAEQHELTTDLLDVQEVGPALTSKRSPRSGNATSSSPSASSRQLRKRPLPATVEDATPSDANASPTAEDSENDDEEEADCEDEASNSLVFDINNGANLAELMSMFEDPYGLLAASGIPMPQQAEKQPLSASDSTRQSEQVQSASSANTVQDSHGPDLSHIELFKSFDFGPHLDFFDQAGTNGMAASMGSGGSTASKADGGKAATRTSPRKHQAK